MPLVELSPGAKTDPAVTAKLKALLERIGKVPVVCAARPGYIVPRIQALAMNEAARMVEEGVASAEEIDKAIKYGFGFRFAVLGLLEFIDWGGGDILFYASRYLTKALDNERYAAPEIVERNMREGHIGLTTRKGFLNYEGLDLDAYRAQRMKEFIGMLGFLDLVKPPVLRTDFDAVMSGTSPHATQPNTSCSTPAFTTTVLSTVMVVLHHRHIEVPGGVAAGELVGAGGEQEIARHRAQFGAVGVARSYIASAS